MRALHYAKSASEDFFIKTPERFLIGCVRKGLRFLLDFEYQPENRCECLRAFYYNDLHKYYLRFVMYFVFCRSLCFLHYHNTPRMAFGAGIILPIT